MRFTGLPLSKICSGENFVAVVVGCVLLANSYFTPSSPLAAIMSLVSGGNDADDDDDEAAIGDGGGCRGSGNANVGLGPSEGVGCRSRCFFFLETCLKPLTGLLRTWAG